MPDIVPKLHYKYSTKAYGNMSFKWGPYEDVLHNRTGFLNSVSLSLPNCVTMTSDDNGNIAFVKLHDKNKGMLTSETAFNADALITSEPNLGLFLLTADCLPLILFDNTKQVLALIHLSRKMLDRGMIENVVNHLIEQHSVSSINLQAILGPAIYSSSYYLHKAPNLTHSEWCNFTLPHPLGGIHLDVIGFTLKMLIGLGIPTKNIINSNIDTAANDQYFSHFRSHHFKEAEGRLATVCYFSLNN